MMRNAAEIHEENLRRMNACGFRMPAVHTERQHVQQKLYMRDEDIDEAVAYPRSCLAVEAAKYHGRSAKLRR